MKEAGISLKVIILNRQYIMREDTKNSPTSFKNEDRADKTTFVHSADKRMFTHIQ